MDEVRVMPDLEPGANEEGGGGGGWKGSLVEAALAARFRCCRGVLRDGWLDCRGEDVFCHLEWEFGSWMWLRRSGVGMMLWCWVDVYEDRGRRVVIYLFVEESISNPKFLVK